MINKENGFFILTCEVCGEEAGESFFDFHEAVDHKKANGWKSQKRGGEWEDVCPDCAQAKG